MSKFLHGFRRCYGIFCNWQRLIFTDNPDCLEDTSEYQLFWDSFLSLSEKEFWQRYGFNYSASELKNELDYLHHWGYGYDDSKPSITRFVTLED